MVSHKARFVDSVLNKVMDTIEKDRSVLVLGAQREIL